MGIDKFNHEGDFDSTIYKTLTDIQREEVAADKMATYLHFPNMGYFNDKGQKHINK